MPFKTRKSRLVGPARLPDGGTTTAYRTLTEHTCSHCQRTISPGELFSRHTARFEAGRGVMQATRQPVCTACRPLHVDGAQEGSPRWP